MKHRIPPSFFPSASGVADSISAGWIAHCIERLSAFLITVAVVSVFLFQLESYGLLEPDEGRYGEVAREMAAPGGDWLVPHINGVPRFQKPPLFSWLGALSIRTFGPNEFAVRLPGALSAVAVLFLSAGIARRLFQCAKASQNTFFVLASSPLFLALARLTTPDMHMTFWITVAIYCLVRSGEKPVFGWLFFLSAGLGFLTKGPVAFLVPFSTASVWTFAHRRQLSGPVLPWKPGLLLAIGIGLSWFVVVSLKTPGLANWFVREELLGRFASNSHGRSRPFWFFLPVVFAGFLPWSLILLKKLPFVFKNRKTLPPEFAFFCGWILIPFIILSFSGSKLPTYILPLFPGLAISVGGLLTRENRDRFFRINCVFIIAAIAIAPVVANSITGTSVSVSGLAGACTLIAIATFLILFRKTKSVPIPLIALLSLIAWTQYPSRISHWNPLLERQATVKPLAHRSLAETGGDLSIARVIACEIRAHGLEFYLGRYVEITRSESDLKSFNRTTETHLPTIHEKPIHVARIPPDPRVAIYVVTRRHRYERDFQKRGWKQLQTEGDFILLER